MMQIFGGYIVCYRTHINIFSFKGLWHFGQYFFAGITTTTGWETQLVISWLVDNKRAIARSSCLVTARKAKSKEAIRVARCIRK